MGLALSLDREYDVTKVTVDTQKTGWGASIYVSDQPVDSLTSLADWGPARAQGSDLAEVAHLRVRRREGPVGAALAHPAAHRAEQQGETKHFVEVAEVKVA